MNWAAMTSREVRSYAPLHATTPLEVALVAMVEEDARNAAEDDELNAELNSAMEAAQQAESKLDSLKEELFSVLDDEDGDDAHLLRRVREVLASA